jgi:hypothetical protein
MSHRTANEIHEDTAEFGLITFAQFQMFRCHHQRHQVIFIVRKIPAGGKNR